jgi:hypothetical protein
MNDYEKSIFNIKQVATSLGDLLPQFIFIGGATVGLYSTIEGAINARPTKDIDILAKTYSLAEYELLEEELRKKGFANDIESNVICRWRLKQLIVDIMYPHPKKFGFVNRWYEEAIENTITQKIDDDLEIKIFNVIYFIATKIEAYNNRGEDCRWDSDFSDIIYVLANRHEFKNELFMASDSVRNFIINFFKELAEKDIYDCILANAPDIGGEEGANYVDDLITEISNYGEEKK